MCTTKIYVLESNAMFVLLFWHNICVYADRVCLLPVTSSQVKKKNISAQFNMHCADTHPLCKL